MGLHQFGALLAVVGATGCMSMTGLTGARAVGEGDLHVALGVSLMPAFGDDEAVGMPVMDVIVRVGLGGGADLGLRLNSVAMLLVDAKVELAKDGDAAVAVMPGLGVSLAPLLTKRASGRGTFLQLDLPVLVDVRASDEVTVTLAPRYTLLWAPGSGGLNHLAGGELDVRLQVSDNAALVPFAATLFGLGEDDSVLEAVGQYGLGIDFK